MQLDIVAWPNYSCTVSERLTSNAWLQAPVLLSQQKVYTKAPVPTQARLLMVRVHIFPLQALALLPPLLPA